MSQGQYTFGPVGGAGTPAGTPPPPDPKKQVYTFGPAGVEPAGPAGASLPDAIAGAEGAKAGDNNPGNLSTGVAKQVGVDSTGSRQSTGVGATQIAQFASPEVGREALTKYLASFPAETTLKDLAEKYAPGQPEWLSNVSKKLGVSPAATIGSVTKVPPAVAPVVKPPVAPPQGFSKGTPEAKAPFQSGVVSGMGIDTSKLTGRSDSAQWAEVVKQATKGMGDWMDSTIKDPAHIADPFEGLARLVEFHIPKPASLGGGHWDPFDLKKAGIDETALDAIGKGIKSGDSAKIENGAGRFVGGLATIAGGLEAPEVGKIPKALGEVASDVRMAHKKAVIIAAANNVLEGDMKNVIVPTIVKGVKATQESIGRRVANIVDADKVDNVAKGKAGSFTRIDVANAIKQAVDDTNAGKVAKPGVSQVIKALSRYGQDMTWDNMKDLRGAIDEAMFKSGGKDLAALGRLREWSTNQLKDRATALGKTDAWEEYNDVSRKLNDHKRGIISKLQDANTGLKGYNELAKASNQPQLNELFSLLERHGGIPANFVRDMVKSRKGLHDLANLSEGGDAGGVKGGRMGAVLRHPKMAGAAMIGTGMGMSMSPIPLTGSFVASLIAAQKVANFMDRYDAAKNLRKIGEAAQRPRVPLVTPPPQGATPTGGGATPSPQAPPPSGPPSVTTQAPVPTSGMPAAPASLDDLMSRISNASKQGQANREVMMRTEPTSRAAPEGRGGTLPAELHADLEKQAGRKLTNDEAISLDRANLERGMATSAPGETGAIREAHRERLEGKGRSQEPWKMSAEEQKKEGWVGPVYRGTHAGKTGSPAVFFTTDPEYARAYSSEGGYSGSHLKHDSSKVSYSDSSVVETYYVKNAVKTTENKPWGMGGSADVFQVGNVNDAVKAPTNVGKAPKVTPYETFGVKLDKSSWTTPESVTVGKLAAKSQIEEIGRARYKEIQAMKDPLAQKEALSKLDSDVKAANRSVDRIQSTGKDAPQVSAKARDRIRKEASSLKIKPAEREVLESLSPEQVSQKSTQGITNDELAMIEVVDITRELEKHGPTVMGVVNKILKQAGGDDAAALPTLRALAEQVRKAKKPAAD